jgi:hypothetical protein
MLDKHENRERKNREERLTDGMDEARNGNEMRKFLSW